VTPRGRLTTADAVARRVDTLTYPNRPDRLLATGVATLSSRDRLLAAGVAIPGAEAPATDVAFFGADAPTTDLAFCGTDVPATDVAHNRFCLLWHRCARDRCH